MNKSALYQAWKHMHDHDSGIITALCEKYTEEDHTKRNLSLTAKLRQCGYFILRVNGFHTQGYGSNHAREVDAVLFLVADIADSGCLEQKLYELGGEFEQEFILFVAAGGADGKLIGTSRPTGEIKKLSNPVFSENGEISNQGNHPFILSERAHTVPPLGTVNGRWGNSIAANAKWEDLTVQQ